MSILAEGGGEGESAKISNFENLSILAERRGVNQNKQVWKCVHLGKRGGGSTKI